MTIRYPDGSTEDLGDNPAPAQREAARLKFERLRDAQGGKLSPTGVLQEARASGAPIATGRQLAQVVTGGLAAAPAAATGNVPLAALNFVSGAGVAGELVDAFTGQTDIRRAVVTGLGAGTASMLPFTKTLSFAKQMLTGALASGVAGQLYDLTRGGSASPGEATASALRDTLGGALQAGFIREGRAQTQARQQETLKRRDLRTPAERQELQRIGTKERIPLSAADITGSRTAARIENIPSRALIGSDRALDFRVKQVEAAEASVARHLARIDTLASKMGDRDPTTVGLQMRRELRGLTQRFRRAADQAYRAEAQMMPGASVQPNSFVGTARKILEEESRSPFPTPGVVQASIDANVPTSAGTAIVLYDPMGRPVTLQQIANGTEPLTWRQARHSLARLGERAFKSSAPIGTVDDAIKQRLWGALKDDMADTQSKYPMAAEFSKWVDEGYGAMKSTINDRLRPLLQKPRADRVLPHIIEPGAVETTTMLREVLPRDVFDYASAAWLKGVYEKTHVDIGGGRRRFSPQRFVNAIKPFDDSGQLDTMFDAQTAKYLRDFRSLTPAFATAEKIAGNPSGTGQAMIGEQQARQIVQQGLRMVGGPVAAMTGGVAAGGQTGAMLAPLLGEAAPAVGATLGGAGGLAMTAVAPRVVGDYVFSPRGIDRLSRFVTGPNPDDTMRTLFRHYLTAIPAQGIAATAVPPPTPADEPPMSRP